jgi:hypothetical protein
MAQLNCRFSHWPCCHRQIICNFVSSLSRPPLPSHLIRSRVPARAFAPGQSSMAMRCYTTYDPIFSTAYTSQIWLHALRPAHSTRKEQSRLVSLAIVHKRCGTTSTHPTSTAVLTLERISPTCRHTKIDLNYFGGTSAMGERFHTRCTR